LIYIALIVAAAATMLPFVWMVLSSFKSQGEILRDPTGFFPADPTWSNYAKWFDELNIQKFFLNSLLVAVVTVLGNLAFCSMVGYALAKMDFPGKRLLFGLVMVTLMTPGVVTFVPLFVLTSKLGLVNTYPRAVPAVSDDTAGRVPDASVHARHSGLVDRSSPDRRGRRDPDFRTHRPAVVRATARDAGHPDVSGIVEQLPLATGRCSK
jgi:hypothetical protein